MTDLNRRRFLQVAGRGAAATMLSGSIARAAAIPAAHRTGSLRDIEHIVVLMQENRSFDHYFGSLRGVRGFDDPRPVALANGKPVWYQPDGTKDVLPFRPRVKDLGLQFIQDLPHGWTDTHAAWNQGRYDKWVPAKGTTTMAYLAREDIPFHYALADTFTICDAYHCSFMGSTEPVLHVDRVHRQRRQGRRPGHRQRREGVQLDHLPGAAGTGGGFSQVLDALTAVPEVWSKTALPITYDENDGFFDHIVPPYAPPSAAQGASTVDITGEVLNGLTRLRAARP